MDVLKLGDRNFNYQLNLVWTLDPFATMLQNLKPNETHAFQSPEFLLWFGEKWHIKLTFQLQTLRFRGYRLKTALVNLCQEKPESHISKGTYTFCISANNFGDKEVEIHNSSELKSETTCNKDTPWIKAESVKLRIKVDFCSFKNSPECKAFGFNLGERLFAIKETEPVFDLTIVVGGQELKANKAVLALASPVFSAMFKHDFKEKQTQSVHLEDKDVETVQKFLHFAYTGQNPELTDMKSAVKLLNMSEKYQVAVLEEECKAYIQSAICEEKTFNEMIALLKITV